MDRAPDLSVSIVTRNSAACVEALFETLARQQGVEWELCVVDNASTDKTPGMLAQPRLSRRLANLTLNSRNVGHGAAHNQNLDRFAGRHVLFMNPDVTLAPDVFAGLVALLDSDPTIGAAAPNLREGPSRTPFPPRRFYPGEGMVPLTKGLFRNEYAWASGACLAVRRSLFEELRGFDPAFFLYADDIDLCLRIRRAGYRIEWRPDLKVIHEGLQSQLDVSEYERRRRLFVGIATFWEKHYSPADVYAMARFQRVCAGLLMQFNMADRRFASERLRARRDVCTEWLARHDRPPGSIMWKIAARQAAIAAEWIRQGRFPLDDY